MRTATTIEPCVKHHSARDAPARGLSGCSRRLVEVHYGFTGPLGRLYGMRRTAARSLVNFSLRTASGPEGSSAK